MSPALSSTPAMLASPGTKWPTEFTALRETAPCSEMSRTVTAVLKWCQFTNGPVWFRSGITSSSRSAEMKS
jgi:hypothetical protein